MEYSIIGKMLMEGLGCYVPLVDGNKTERNGEKKEYCKRLKNTSVMIFQGFTE